MILDVPLLLEDAETGETILVDTHDKNTTGGFRILSGDERRQRSELFRSAGAGDAKKLVRMVAEGSVLVADVAGSRLADIERRINAANKQDRERQALEAEGLREERERLEREIDQSGPGL